MLDTILLLLSLIFGFFLPGWFTVQIFFARSLTQLEASLYAVTLSLTLIDSLSLILNRLHIPLSTPVMYGALLTINLGLGIWYWTHRQKQKPTATAIDVADVSPKTWSVLLVMLMLTIAIKAYYLIPAGLPTATDMGHHMYWSQYISEKGSLPTYQKIEVTVDRSTGATTLSQPRPIADFIVGEHIPFATLTLLSGLPLIGSFPVLTLLVINILSLLALLALTTRIGERLLNRSERSWFMLATFLLIGPLFTLASPQAKFVSGGVVGNLIGNLFIPLILLALYRGLRDQSHRFLVLALTLLATLAYTHHLSTLILGFVVIGIALMSSLASYDHFRTTFRQWLHVIWSPGIGIALLLVVGFGASVALPSYLNLTAIDTALGSPVKSTRIGLTLAQVSDSVGTVKAALALAGFVLVIGSFTGFRSRDPLAWAILIGWGGALALMTLQPNWVWLDIPSGRVGSYLVYPSALLGGFALMNLLTRLAKDQARRSTLLLGLLLLSFIITDGLFENTASLASQTKNTELQEVLSATRYLSQTTGPEDVILKDHNYLVADAWMKLFFLRDYGYPLSRGLFSRYEETGNRNERCTLVMIASPNSDEAKRCFESTGTNYIVINPRYDSIQFEKSPDFAKVYSSNHIAVFRRK